MAGAGCNIPVIEEVLKAFVADSDPHVIHFDPPLDLRTLAAELGLLPVLLDMGGCMGLRPSGEVVSFPWDDPRQVKVESDERVRNIVLFRSGLKYPPLMALKPQRPPEAPTCSHCSGSGKASGMPGRLADSIVCYCGGLGWLPQKFA
jgi:hypothetical protein